LKFIPELHKLITLPLRGRIESGNLIFKDNFNEQFIWFIAACVQSHY